MALSFVVTKDQPLSDMVAFKDIGRGRDVYDDKVYARVVKQQKEKKAELTPYAFDKKHVEGFKYRVQDALRNVSKLSVKEARIAEIKREILNSEKLKVFYPVIASIKHESLSYCIRHTLKTNPRTWNSYGTIKHSNLRK